MKNKKSKINILNTKRACIFLILLMIFSVFSYGYSYHVSVSYASSVEELEDKISNIKSEISELEFQIVEGKRNVDKEIAVSKGFVEIEDITFIKKRPSTALNANTN